MSGNLQCIGVRTADVGAFAQCMETLVEKAIEDAPCSGKNSHVRWTDPSGASIAFHLKRGKIDCVTPYFSPREGLSRWRVKTHGPSTDPDCIHCSGVDCDILGDDGDMVTRATVQLLHFQPYHEWLKRPQSFDLEVVSFAYEASFYKTKSAYEEGQRSWWTQPGEEEPRNPDGKPLRFAECSFVPEGMFVAPNSPMTDRARALYTGTLEGSKTITNEETGISFQHLRIKTLTGMIDTVLDPETSEGEAACGNIALIRAWLVGRPIVPYPEYRSGFWGRLLGKRDN